MTTDYDFFNKKDEYREVYNKAIKDNMPLVVYVKCQPRFYGNWYSIRYDDFPDAKEGIIISYPNNGSLYFSSVLPYDQVNQKVVENEINRLKKSFEPLPPIRQMMIRKGGSGQSC